MPDIPKLDAFGLVPEVHIPPRLSDSNLQKRLGTSVPLSRFYDAANPPANYDDAFAQAMATGYSIFVDKPGRYPTSLTVLDQNLQIAGVKGAILVQRLGQSVLTASATPTFRADVGAVGDIFWWKNLARSADSMPIVEGVRLISLANPELLSTFKRGDKLFIESNLMYRDKTYVTSSASDEGTFKASSLGNTGIKGIALRVNGSATAPGTVLARSIAIGATSGATALVSSVAVDYLTKDGNGNDVPPALWLMFDAVSKAFTPGENITVGGAVIGTAASAGSLVPSYLMEDTSWDAGQLKLWQYNDAMKVSLDIEIDTATDPETAVGGSDRKVAITLEGLVDANVRYHMHRGYKAALVLMSVLGGSYYGSGGNLSNIPEEDAFGYLAMLRGFTHGARLELHGVNCRHVLTTNAYALATRPTNPLSILRASGTVKYNYITGTGRENTAAAWDTHAGGWRNHFDNITAVNTRPTGKNDAMPVGIQNRSFATIVTNAMVVGMMIGVLDHTYRWEAEVDNTVNYRDVGVFGYMLMGFYHGTSTNVASTTRSRTRYVIDKMSVAADTRYGIPPFEQIGFCLGGAETILIDPVSRDAAHADVQVRFEIPKLSILGKLTSSCENAPAAAAGSGYIVQFKAQVESTRRAVVMGIDFLNNVTGDARRAVFRAEQAITARLRRPAQSSGAYKLASPTGTGPALSEVGAAGTGGTPAAGAIDFGTNPVVLI